VGSIEVRICLFIMVTQHRLGLFTFGQESLGYDKCLNLNFEFLMFACGNCEVLNFVF
jgi:hypothetical protein